MAEAYPKAQLYGHNETDFWLAIKPVEREDGMAKINIATRRLESDEAAALRIFNQVLEEKGHPLYGVWQPRIYEELARFYTEKGDYAKAGNYFRDLFRIQGTLSPYGYFIYANYLAKTGKLGEGEKIVLNMARLYPGSHLVMLHAARFYILARDYAKAEDWLRKDYQSFGSPETAALLQAVRAQKNK